MITSSRMIKYLALPLILVGCTAPITDPPAHAHEKNDKDLILIPRQELKGEIDIYEPMHWHSINQMFIRNQRRKRIEENATPPTDAINRALMEFENGSDDTAKQKELLQLSSDGNKSSS